MDLYIITKIEEDHLIESCPSYESCGAYDSIDKAEVKICELYENAKKNPHVYSVELQLDKFSINSDYFKTVKRKGFRWKPCNESMKEWVSEWS